MSAPKPPYDHLSEEELLRYLRGELSGTDANRMERKVLDSSFENEAMEGWEQMAPEELASDLEQIRAGLPQKRRRKVIWWQVAAIGSLLIVSGFVLRYFVQEINDEKQIVQESVSVEPEVAPAMPKKVEDLYTYDTLKSPDLAKVSSRDKSTAQHFASKSAKSKPLRTQSPVVINESRQLDLEQETVSGADNEVKNEDVELDLLADLEVEEVLETPSVYEVKIVDSSDLAKMNRREKGTIAGDKLSAAYAFAPASANSEVLLPTYRIVGSIMDVFDKQPIEGARVVVKGTEISAVTDAAGYFVIDKEEAENKTLEIVSTGYETKEISMVDSVKISLEPDLVALEDVTLFDFEEKEEEEDNDDDTYFSPGPDQGWDAFRSYIHQNQIYPDAAREARITGTVKIKLTLSETGEILQMDVKKSLGFGCDQEAIRLIRSGPKWLPAARGSHPYESSLVVRIRFK